MELEKMNKTKTALQNFCVNFSQFSKFILDRILQIWAWIFNHRNFNVLAQNRRWNFTKKVSQIFVIFFSRSLPHHCFSRARILHSVHISFIIFFVFWIFMYFFFPIFINKSNYSNPKFQNFSPTKLIYGKDSIQHSNSENREILTWN